MSLIRTHTSALLRPCDRTSTAHARIGHSALSRRSIDRTSSDSVSKLTGRRAARSVVLMLVMTFVRHTCDELHAPVRIAHCFRNYHSTIPKLPNRRRRQEPRLQKL